MNQSEEKKRVWVNGDVVQPVSGDQTFLEKDPDNLALLRRGHRTV